MTPLSSFQNIMNSKHLYCTVAVGEYYLTSALNMAKTLNDVSDSHHFLIVTNHKIENVPNTTIELLPNDSLLFFGNCFNYMLKYYPLYVASTMEYENIIFIDADWRIRTNYNKNNISGLFNFMDNNNYDVLFERPYSIGTSKLNGRDCIFHHKINFYKLLENI